MQLEKMKRSSRCPINRYLWLHLLYSFLNEQRCGEAVSSVFQKWESWILYGVSGFSMQTVSRECTITSHHVQLGTAWATVSPQSLHSKDKKVACLISQLKDLSVCLGG